MARDWSRLEGLAVSGKLEGEEKQLRGLRGKRVSFVSSALKLLCIS